MSFAPTDPHDGLDHLFVYSPCASFSHCRAVGLRGTNHGRYERAGGSVRQWLRLRGDTARLMEAQA